MDRFQQLRLLEALIFASSEPVAESVLLERMPEDTDIVGLLEELAGIYANRGVNLQKVGKGWAFRTAEDLADYFTIEREVARKLSRAAVETLAIIAYHQPITRAEIEEIRGVALSRGTLDTLLEIEWIRPRGRRRAPGKPVTWGTTEGFLAHFGLEELAALPGMDELKAAGLLDNRPGAGILAMRGEENTDEAEDEEDAEDLDERTAFLENDEVFESVENDEHIALED